jgi:histidinol-phosphate aminotransferase
MNPEELIRPMLLRSEAYSPVEPVEVLGEEIGVSIDRLVKLDGNENPYGCSPRVQRALSDYSRYHFYPDPDQRELREALSRYVNLGPEHIVGGQGSDDLIDLILRLFVDPGDKVVNCTPTFGMYSFSTQVCGGEVVAVPRGENFAVDVDRVKSAIDERAKVIFLASPNNPSGNVTPEDRIVDLLDTGVVVVVDEAYYEFSGVTVAPLMRRYDNLIVLRTFSKWAGLAGLRVGYGLFPAKIGSYIMKIKQPYNVNAAASLAAIESLRDIDYLQGTIGLIIDERDRLFAGLGGLAGLRPLQSQANFILCSVEGRQAKAVREALRRQGILVRHFDSPGLQGYLRTSVGKP